jgi:hypothetical protein
MEPMRTRTYRIIYAATASDQPGSDEIDAEAIGHVHDGTRSWLNFHDQVGEVLRVRSDAVERIERLR